ncbi:MAG TPA: RsmE family RNA methyltransferase [Bacilli bacterium]|nr:RsmE family RNA methyltransferase [Bacilli bacterium]
MTRYFARVSGEHALLSSSDEHHLLHVLRARVGTKIEVVHQAGLYLCEVVAIKPLLIEIREHHETSEAQFKLTLIYGLPKGEKIDFVIQKATELGVHHIVLVRTARSIVKWADADVARKLARYETIIKASAEQSRRHVLPELSFASSLSEIWQFEFDKKLIASEYEVGKQPVDVCLNAFKNIAILVGPEGGFDKTEIESAIANGYQPISLGRNILRSETAAIAALAMIGYIKEHAIA